MPANQSFINDNNSLNKKQNDLSLLCIELEKEIEGLKYDAHKLKVDILEVSKKHKISNILKHIIDLPQN